MRFPVPSGDALERNLSYQSASLRQHTRDLDRSSEKKPAALTGFENVAQSCTSGLGLTRYNLRRTNGSCCLTVLPLFIQTNTPSRMVIGQCHDVQSNFLHATTRDSPADVITNEQTLGCLPSVGPSISNETHNCLHGIMCCRLQVSSLYTTVWDPIAGALAQSNCGNHASFYPGQAGLCPCSCRGSASQRRGNRASDDVDVQSAQTRPRRLHFCGTSPTRDVLKGTTSFGRVLHSASNMDDSPRLLRTTSNEADHPGKLKGTLLNLNFVRG